ncbi:dynein regulatory complex subunit 3 [Gymnodraco acuticeps]|uniref:Dynein regulatory complex subunit 3 n=1 Tax=Gymnodraco acuticeps TaxID=8218 RepID=A0A6P8UIY5_GYMAC|nr:dynein regulatory complex subunit 3 [Gymnodraco acuticeps]
MMSRGMLINEDLLQRAILEQEPKDKGQGIANEEGTQLDEILKLCLEFRNILRIDHLWEFTSLARLNLNNNLIENIEGLDHLINLTWLDLSFNGIELIEGLESLQKLEVLNLSDNNISVLENMETLERLTHFSIANNLLGELDIVLYLRKFKNLFNINLFGNPCSKEGDYTLFIAAFFPDLKFLDYTLLDENTKKEASIKHRYVLEEMKCEELHKQKAEKAEQRKEAEAKLHTDAFVEFLNGSDLFKCMFNEDQEADKLHRVPEITDLLLTFEKQMGDLCKQIFETGLAEHKRRDKEVNCFFTGQNETVIEYQQKALHILANFEQQHKERTVDMRKLSDRELLKVKINQCNDEINQLCKGLMTLEFQMVSQLEDITKRLDINISEMVGYFTEMVQGTFAQCRDLEDDYNGKVRVSALALLDDASKDNLDEFLPDDVRILFTDKETVMDALATGHDNHLMKINDRETQLVSRVNSWKVALIKGIQDKDLKENRMRIKDLHRYMDHLLVQLEEFQ